VEIIPHKILFPPFSRAFAPSVRSPPIRAAALKRDFEQIHFVVGNCGLVVDGKLGSWESQSPKVRKTDTFVVFYLFVLYSVTCQKTCHFTACFTSLRTFISFSILIMLVMSSGLFIFVDIYHFNYTFSHAHIEAHALKHTCMISTQEEWRQPDTGAWLGGAEEMFLSETKA